MGCVGFQIQNSGESVFSEGGPACLVCPAMPSKQSCPRANADQRGSLGGEPIKIPTSLAGSICPTSRVQMILGYSVGLLPSRWAAGLGETTVTLRFPWWLLLGTGVGFLLCYKTSVHPTVSGRPTDPVFRSPRSLPSPIPCREPWPLRIESAQ